MGAQAEPANKEDDALWESRDSILIFETLFLAEDQGVETWALMRYRDLKDSNLQIEISILMLKYWETFEGQREKGTSPLMGKSKRTQMIKLKAIRVLANFLKDDFEEVVLAPTDDLVSLRNIAEEAEKRLGKTLAVDVSAFNSSPRGNQRSSNQNRPNKSGVQIGQQEIDEDSVDANNNGRDVSYWWVVGAGISLVLGSLVYWCLKTSAK